MIMLNEKKPTMKFLKEKGIVFKKADIIYLNSETGLVTNEYNDAHEVMGYASEDSGKRKKHVSMGSGKNEAIKNALEIFKEAKVGKPVLYITTEGGFQIEKMFDRTKFETTVEIMKVNETPGNITFDRLCRGFPRVRPKIEQGTQPLFVLDDVEKMTEQMQNFGYKPGQGQKRELTHFESFQLLVKERKNLASEFLLHDFAFFDFILGIAVGIIVTMLSLFFQ